MAAKSWDDDFRKDAIKASIRKLGTQYGDDPFRYDGSFCLPAGETPVPFWTPGKFSLLALVVGFGLLIGGVAIISLAENDPGNGFPVADGEIGDPNPALVTLAALCSLSGIATFFIPVKGDKLIIRWMLGERARAKLDEFDSDHVISSELGNAGKDQKLSIDGDDHVLIFFDDENRKLLIEGIGARYQVRAEDVVSLSAFEFMNYLGAEIVCRVDEQTNLEFTVARVSLLYELLKQIPILWFLKKRIQNPLLTKCERTLQFSEAEDVADHEWEELEAAE